MKSLLYLVPAAVFLFTGCAQQKSEVYANFLMPPKEIKNVEDVKNLKIDVNIVKFKGLNNKASKDISNLIKGKLAALVYKEQFLNVSDDLLGKSLGDLNKKSKNQHGYGKFYADKPSASRLVIDASINIRKTTGKEKVEVELLSQSYTVKYGKGKYPKPYSVPSGQPSISYSNNIVPFINYVATADLSIKLYNSNKKVIYTKLLPNLKLEKKIGGKSTSVTELPTDLSITSELLTDKLRQIVFDLSPHNESRKLVLNEKGDASVVALMKATAFSEAANRLSDVITEKEEAIEAQKKKLSAKLEESLKKAKDKKAKDSLNKSYDNDVKNLYVPLSADYENMGILNEIFGDLETSNYYYEEAINANKLNTHIKLSIKRVNTTMNQQNILKNMTNKSSYKNKDNKDR